PRALHSFPTRRSSDLLWSLERLNYDFYDISNIRPGWERRPSVIASNIIYSHRAAGMDDAAIVQATQAEICLFLAEASRARVIHADRKSTRLNSSHVAI